MMITMYKVYQFKSFFMLFILELVFKFSLAMMLLKCYTGLTYESHP